MAKSRSAARSSLRSSRKKPLLVKDASQDARFQNKSSVKGMFIRSVLAAPLEADGDVVGALYLESRSIQRFFTEKELDLFTKILNLSSKILASSVKRLIASLQKKPAHELHMRQAKGNRTHAATSLGVTREGLRKMMKRFGME